MELHCPPFRLPSVSAAPAKKLTLPEMAALLQERIVDRCRLLDGTFAGQTWLLVEPNQLDGLKQIVATLEFMAPHADTIKRAIQGKRR